MGKKISTEKFILKAKNKHGDKYDYSLVEYKGSLSRVKIICKKHGVFIQQAVSHIRGCGCSKCAGTHRYTTKEYIETASKIHNNKYDYSKTIYKNSFSLITIICPIHGEFSNRQAREHLLKNNEGGCGVCISLSRKRPTGTLMPNDNITNIEKENNCKVILLTNGKYALVDEEDYYEVRKFNWAAISSRNTFYAVKNSKNNRIMHRFIMGLERGDNRVIDHINHDGLDNRKANLRICTNDENVLNKKPSKNKRFKGAFYYAKNNSWTSSISYKGKCYRLGYFKTEEEAARAYDAKAKELHKEFAYLNFPNE